MNYLSHHVVARAVAAQLADGPAPAAFYIGNALPDLLSTSGEGRLRARNVLAPPPGVNAALVDGIRLHLATDQRFHGHPLFKQAMTEASDLLRAAPFSTPLRRVFFLAHAFVEIALDGWLLRQTPAIADDFYAQFEAADLVGVVTETGSLSGSETPLLGLAHTLDRFTKSQYLRSYADESGMAEALHRISYRVSLADLFAASGDRALLGVCYGEFLPRLGQAAPELLVPPATPTMIQ